jgi:hypothetical protein
MARVEASLQDGTFVRLNLGIPVNRDGIRNVFLRPVELKEGRMLSFLYRYPTRDMTRNFPYDEALVLLRELLGRDFLNGFLSATNGTAQLTFRKGRTTRLVLGKAEVTAPPDLAHDRPKKRTVPTTLGWLRELGVTVEDGSVKAGMEAKYRQIHRFVEVFHPLLVEAALPADAPLEVVDMGCGKAYLTFAVYEHLRGHRSGPLTVTGVEARGDLVTYCRGAAERCGYEGLQFAAGDIATAKVAEGAILMALHACDTATDEALAKGVLANAPILLVSPCCHQEVRPQLSAPPVLAGALRHGIFRERQAEFVTDALRAALLEWAGYDTRVFEFISTEHTGKNLMIAAVKSRRPVDRETAAAAVRSLAAAYGVRRQRLAERIGFALVPAAPIPATDAGTVAN